MTNALGSLSREQKKKIVPYVLIAPVLIYYIVFWLFPVIRAVSGSFMSAPGSEGGIFTFNNYISLFRDPVFYQALFNTAFIVLISVSVEFLLAFGLALLINMKFHGSGLFLFLALIPMSLPAVAVGAIWTSGLSTYGWLNSFLVQLGIIDITEKIIFFGGGHFSKMLLVIIVDAWQVIPSVMVILLSGMQGLQPEMLEAGYVFGGNRFQVLRKVTVPLLKPTITTAMILRIISAIQIWLIIVMLFGYNRLPVLLEQIVLNVDLYTGSEEFFRKGLALSVIVSLIVSCISFIYLKVSGAFVEPSGKVV